jgi:hypothetical protein
VKGSTDLTQTWIDVGIVTGLLAGVAYGLPQLPFVRGPLHDFFFFGFGPLLSVGAIGMYHFFRRYREAVSNQLAHLFLFVAGVSFTYMATMQGSIYHLIPRYYHAAEEADRELWRTILKGVSPTQLGLDFAFDIFVSVATVLIGLQMFRHPRFWKAFGVAGMVIGATGLTFNFITFPDNSGEAGLVDPGPFFGVWMTAAAIQVWRCRRWVAGEGADFE